MKCTGCGKILDYPVKFCPDCGAPVKPDEAQPAGQAYVRADYDPAKDGRLKTDDYSPQPVQRPSSTGMIVFAVINMLCCGFGISFILGIIALVFAIMSGSGQTFEESQNKLKTAKILNFIGLGFVVLQFVALVVFIIASVLFAGQFSGYRNFDPWYFDPGYYFDFHLQ